MRIGNHKSLTEMARKSPHNTEFVEKLKTATSEIFDQTMDKLLINKSASSDEKIAVLEDLKDLRGAVLASVKMPEAARKANLKATLDNSPSRAEISKDLPSSEPGADGTTIKRSLDKTYLFGPNNGQEVQDIKNGNRYGTRFAEENFDKLTGPKNFLVGLNNVIGLASAVAALPPGPMAMSVGTMAKEEAFSNFGSQASGASASRGETLGICYTKAPLSHLLKASLSTIFTKFGETFST